MNTPSADIEKARITSVDMTLVVWTNQKTKANRQIGLKVTGMPIKT